MRDWGGKALAEEEGVDISFEKKSITNEARKTENIIKNSIISTILL